MSGREKVKIVKGVYTADNSDLAMKIIDVRYQSSVYAKVKATLYNKINGIFYETKNYKLIKEQIKHWRLQ